MPESRLNVRTDAETMTQAEEVFNALAKEATLLEQEAQVAVRKAIGEHIRSGEPVAMFDQTAGVPYLQYADGHRENDHG